jgi:hypothetical protein
MAECGLELRAAGNRAAVVRRSERRRFSSASDDELGGFHARLREQLYTYRKE